jgi:UDP:flavonoid glycosyltransferase YjiC (YdhE family)
MRKDININMEMQKGKELEIKNQINKILCEYYSNAIAKKIREEIPNKEIPNALESVDRLFRKSNKEYSVKTK